MVWMNSAVTGEDKELKTLQYMMTNVLCLHIFANFIKIKSKQLSNLIVSYYHKRAKIVRCCSPELTQVHGEKKSERRGKVAFSQQNMMAKYDYRKKYDL